MYQCCIFDLDGTLLNTLPALKRTVNMTLGELGLGPVEERHIKKFVGDGYKKLMERALVHCGDEKLVHYEKALKRYNEIFKENCLYGIAPYDGIPELLDFLKSRGVKIAVVSNKGHDRAVENVESVYGKGFFDMITGEQENVRRKPDPSGVLMTAKALGAELEDCLYLGDTNTDMQTGINAGVDTAGVTWGFRDREELMAYHPRYIVDKPEEVMELI